MFTSGKVVDPWGKIIAKCDNDKEVDVVVADIDLGVAAKVRQNMPCLEHRRHDIYSLSAVPGKLQPSSGDFLFEKYPIPEDTIFYQSNHSLAFTNIRCVVPGRILLFKFTKAIRTLTRVNRIDGGYLHAGVNRVDDGYLHTRLNRVDGGYLHPRVNRVDEGYLHTRVNRVSEGYLHTGVN